MIKKERPVKIKIASFQTDYTSDISYELISIADNLAGGHLSQKLFPEKIEMTTEATLRDTGERIELEYEETELTGMEGATTIVSYDKNYPNIVSVLRDGSVSTALVFEAGVRHICTYDTPYMPFELCVVTISLSNELTFEGGNVSLDYIVETGGEHAERTRLHLSILP